MPNFEAFANLEETAASLWENLSPIERAAYATLVPNSILIETGDMSGSDAWFDSLTREGQEAYLKEHPKSKLRNRLKPRPPKNNPKTDVHVAAPPKQQMAPQSDPSVKNSSGALSPAPENPEHWPEHIRKLRLPPAWTKVCISHDPDAPLQATGFDAKGRKQYVYNEKFAQSQTAIKFARIQALEKELPKIERQVLESQRSLDPVIREHADCAHLIMSTGIRPGSEDDTGAEKQAYGASTLLGQHVVEGENGSILLRFVGKKGIDLSIPVEDPACVDLLRRRAEEAGPGGKLFPHVSARSLLSFVHSLDGGGFKTKDMRTLKGTQEALALVQTMPTPTDKKTYARAVRTVAIHVAKKLGNTPAVALAAYISPVVFADWKSSLEG